MTDEKTLCQTREGQTETYRRKSEESAVLGRHERSVCSRWCGTSGTYRYGKKKVSAQKEGKEHESVWQLQTGGSLEDQLGFVCE